MNIKWAEKLRQGLHGSADSLGNLCVEAFHYLALFGIGAITAYAAVVTFLDMLGKGGISVDHILLLFIYLELGAMVGIYFKTCSTILTPVVAQKTSRIASLEA